MTCFHKCFLNTLIIFIFCSTSALAQNIVTETGEAQVEWPDSKSKLDAEKEAEELATINALEKAFGRAIIQSNSTYVENVNTGSKTETKSGFNMIGNSYVKGEVIKVLEKKCVEVPGTKVIDGKKKDIREIKCTIKIKAKEYIDPPIEFEAITLSCPDKGCKASDYKENDAFYAYFRSEADGYLMIYLDDAKNSEILLPYIYNRDKNGGGLPVKANTDYILFYKNPNDKKNTENVDELQLYTPTYTSLNIIYFVFSSTPMTIPDLKDNVNKVTYFNEAGVPFQLPKSVSSEDFLNWITTNKIRRNNFQVKPISISIKKK